MGVEKIVAEEIAAHEGTSKGLTAQEAAETKKTPYEQSVDLLRKYNPTALAASIPEIIVAGVRYTVSEQPNDVMQEYYADECEAECVEGAEHTQTLLGECNYFNNTIAVNDILERQRQEIVLIHEMTHAIFYEAGFDEQDEDMVNRIGKVLYQVLRDNDFSFLQKKG